MTGLESSKKAQLKVGRHILGEAIPQALSHGFVFLEISLGPVSKSSDGDATVRAG